MTSRTRFVTTLTAAFAASTLLLSSTTTSASVESEREADILRELNGDLERMMILWPGVYENRAQIDTDRRRGFKTYLDGGHAHVYSTVTSVDVPGLGENVLYVEDYMGGKNGKLFRQVIYALTVDVERRAVVIKLHSFEDDDKEAVAGAQHNPSVLRDFTPDDLRSMAGCEMYFRPLGDGYLGAFDYGECTTNGDMIADNRMYLGPGLYWFSDQFRPATEPQPNAAAGQHWHRMTRIEN